MSSSTKAQMTARIAELEQQLAEATKPRVQKSHRKYQVLALLKQGPHATVELAVAMDTSKNNIGSLLTYLRQQDGIIIHRDHEGRHYLPKSD